jgi:bacillithiol system protein YtxJ
MGLSNLFGFKKNSEEKEKKELPWKELVSMEQLDSIVAESKTTPVAIFKHSTRCGISRMVLRQFESAYNIDTNKMSLYFLDLLAFRDVSNEVGIRFQVFHQSPQLLVIKNGNTVAHASHHNINASELQDYI